MAEISKEWAISEKIRILTENRDYFIKEFRVKEIGFFGSFIHNKQKRKSDLDILVDFTETPSLFEFLKLEQNLSSLMGVKVDLVMKGSLKKHIGKRILEEVVYI
jgi:predicted nucleotidyltransferase